MNMTQPRVKTPLMILGNGPTQKKGVRIVREHPGHMETWGCNNLLLPELTLLFQMHGDQFVRARFLDWYKTHPPKCPIVMQHVWRELPTSIPFPHGQYRDMFPWTRLLIHDPDNMADQIDQGGARALEEYHSCTMSYMIALAFMMNRFNPIYIFGIDFYHELRRESTFEKPCVEAHIAYGMGMARDTQVIIPASTRLFTSSDNMRQPYGSQWNPPLSADENIKLNNYYMQNMRGSKGKGDAK